MDPRSLRVGAVAVMPLLDGGYGACQVIRQDEDSVLALALDWHSAEPPSLDDLTGIRPLIVDHHANSGSSCIINIGHRNQPPAGFEWLGELPAASEITVSSSWSGWEYLVMQVLAQRIWDVRLPESVKLAYKAGARRGFVEVDLGAGPATMSAATGGLDLIDPGQNALRTPATGDVRWSALDRLPRCTDLAWAGADRGLIAALAERPILTGVLWHDPPAKLDLRGTSLTGLRLRGDSPRRVRLPRSIQELELVGDNRPEFVEAADRGRWLHLRLDASQPELVIPAGLEGVRTLYVSGGGTMSAGALHRLTDLQELHLTWLAGPGVLTDAEALAALPRLASITLGGCYAFTAQTLPNLSALRSLEVNGLRSSVVKPLKARYRSTAVHLDTWGAKPDRWLDANFHNPFRDWVHVDARGGAAACKAYATATRALDRISAVPAQRAAEAEPILHALIDQLNRIDGKHGFIDTICRDEAGDAFCALAERAGIPADLADEWFDEWRDF